MKDWNFVFAGFGGQGILFAGKVAAYTGMVENREVSWLPSYGPEMRGGTANCSVCLSSRPIGSPLVVEMNPTDTGDMSIYIDCTAVMDTKIVMGSKIAVITNVGSTGG